MSIDSYAVKFVVMCAVVLGSIASAIMASTPAQAVGGMMTASFAIFTMNMLLTFSFAKDKLSAYKSSQSTLSKFLRKHTDAVNMLVGGILGMTAGLFIAHVSHDIISPAGIFAISFTTTAAASYYAVKNEFLTIQASLEFNENNDLVVTN